MKRMIVFLLLIYSIAGLAAPIDDFIKANQLYEEGSFREATKAYEDLLADGYFSPVLHYNLGNAYYRQKEYPRAILHYEKALKFNPSFEDARFNLKLSRQYIKDKPDIPEEASFVTAWKSLVASKTPDGWTFLSIQILLLALSGFVLFRISSSRRWKKTGFYGGLAGMFFFLLLTWFAFNQKSSFYGENEAIVMSPTVTARSVPGAAGANLFVVHEGLKVKISSDSGEWFEVKLINGDKGWIKKSDLAVI